jgi:O-antigen ligase
MARESAVDRVPWRPPEWLSGVPAGSLGLAVGSLLFGVGLVATAAALSEEFTPLLVVAIPVTPLLLAEMLGNPRAAIVSVFLAIPVGFASIHVGILNLQAVDVMLLLGAVVIGLRRLSLGHTPLSWSPPLFWYLAFVVWAFIATVSAVNRVPAVKTLGYLVFGMLFASMILSACRGLRDVRRLLAVLVAVSVPVSLQAVVNLGQLQVFFGGTVFSGRAQGLFTEPNELGFFASMAFFVAVGLGLSARTRLGRWASALSLAVLLLALSLSLSRGAWIGTVAGILLMLATLPDARRLLTRLGVLVMLTLGLLSIYAPSNPDLQVLRDRAVTLASPSRSPDDRRPQIWAEAIRETRSDPWTGVGPGNFQIGFRGSASPFLSEFTTHAHNLYLTTLVENGLPGLTLFMAFLVSLGVAARRAAAGARAIDRNREANLALSLAGGVVAFAVHGTVNGVLGNSIIDVAFWGLVGCLLVCYRELHPRPTHDVLDWSGRDLVPNGGRP